MIRQISAAALALFLSVSAAITGCADKKGGGAEPAAAEDKIIAASFYPIYIAALNVASGAFGVRVVNMAPPAAGCLHDYQMTAADAILIGKAAALIINGGGIDSFLNKAAAANTGLTVVNASEGITFMPNGTRTGNYHAHDRHRHKHHMENNGGENAHAWMSVENHIAQIKNIAAGLSAADTANASIYADNAQRYVNRLTALMESAQADFSSAGNKKIVISHNGLEYLARDFGLTVTAVIEREPGIEPGAAEIVGAIRLIEREQPKAIFTEQARSSPASNMISAKTGVPAFELDMITSGPDEPDAYIRAMERNISVLLEALR